MSKLRPRNLIYRLFAGEFLFEVLLGIGTSAIALVSGTAKMRQEKPEPGMASAYFLVGAFMLVVLTWRAFARNRKAQGENELHALTGVLHTLHALLTELQPPMRDHDLRVCIFVPVCDNCDEVHQLTDYVGGGKPRGRGRNISSRSGVVGKAFRTGESVYDKLPKHAHVVDYLVTAHGFDRGEASTMRADRCSWAAIPVGAAGRVIAVIYLDSSQREFFGNGNQARRKALEAALPGVATFIGSI